MGELVTRWIKTLILFIALWAGVYAWNNVGCRKVEGDEMHPTYPRDRFKPTSPKKFRPEDLNIEDVVFYQYQMGGKGNQEYYAARVVAKPGDRVRIELGDVFVNDQKINATYVDSNARSTETRDEIIVPKGHVYLLADNRRQYAEFDSRGIGPVAAYAIAGRMWP